MEAVAIYWKQYSINYWYKNITLFVYAQHYSAADELDLFGLNVFYCPSSLMDFRLYNKYN